MMVSPDDVVVSGGSPNESFLRNGIFINNTVIVAGLRDYEHTYITNRCYNCRPRIDPKYKAWLVYEDLKTAGWEFIASVFIKDPVSAIMMCDLGF
jgi:hypothetical protein